MIIKVPSVLVGLSHTLFARRSRPLLLSSFALVISVNWLAASTHQMLNWLINGNYKVCFPWYEAVYPAIFIAVFFWARQCYRNLSGSSSLSVTARYEDCDGLVLFLSKANEKDLEAEKKDLELLRSTRVAGSGATPLFDPKWRSAFTSHLRMPLEALYFQYSGQAGKRVPKRVTLLASRESVTYATEVREALERLLKPLGKEVRVVAVEGVGTGNWMHGVDYGAPGEIVAVLEAVYFDHEKNGISPSEVIVDVTSGSTLGSVIASMTALKFGRRVQYTNSNLARTVYSVRVFDLEYTETTKNE